ncbi:MULTISPECIES: HipA family kinase [Vibrio]|uniref:HipA family kinase n=1 Tax=Vibrio TaxID=662 RepID=UPI000C821072|nr:HipA family kinase [Vibrio breoganii]PMP03102.1 hypothetical protein BCS95_09030 [Vibrio breoganii]
MDDKDKDIIPTSSAVKLHTPPAIYQQSLFPIEIIETYPSQEGSADLELIGKGRNSKHYAIKTIHENNGYVPASEFFCYELARLVSIPTPDFDHLKLESGEIAFGSVWEGGVMGISVFSDMVEILTDQIQVEDLDTFLGKVFAFDLFVNNDDRHFGNYIFRDSFQKNKKLALAFDFSRAWKVNDPFGYQSTNAACNTMKYHNYIVKGNKYDKDSAEATLDEISQIESDMISDILNGMHESWMSSDDKEVIAKWWGSEQFHERIKALKGVL